MARLNKNTKRLTLCAVCSALGVVILALGALIEVLDLSSAALAGMFIVIIVVEIGGVWPVMTYAATGLLGLLLPMKLPAVFYLLFAGWYPIAKEKIEKLRFRWVQWIIKFALLNIALTLVIVIGKFVLGLPESEIDLSFVLYLLANIAFLLYDIALSRLISVYILVLRKKFRINKM